MKARYFVALALMFGVVTILGMRYNNITAYEMQAEIMSRDAAGEDVSGELTELEEFVSTHMNASGPSGMRLMLQGSYTRAVEEAQAEAENQVDASIYDEAVAECDREGQLTTDNAECVQNYLSQHITEHETAELPQQKQFSYHYYSPLWTPDIAGLSAIAAIVSLLVASVVYIRYWVRTLKR